MDFSQTIKQSELVSPCYNDIMNYIKLNDQQIIISSFKSIKKIDTKLNVYLDQLLLRDLTTLKGRVDAIKKIYHIDKLTPIYIDNNCCLIPLFNQSYNYNYYLNIYQIKNIIKEDNCSIIHFIDGEKIKVNKKRTLILKQIAKARLIKNNN